MTDVPGLIDREREASELRALAASDRKQLAVLSGRRQVGKTYLLSRVWHGRRVFYFLATDLAPNLNRRDLIDGLREWSGSPLDPADYPTWRTVFRALVALAEDGPLVVILDEVQHLLVEGEGVASQLVAVWDLVPPAIPLTLVLSGSEVSAMARLQGGGEPLYGRITWSTTLRPFDYRDAARMAPHLGPRDAARLYGMLGGMPRYLATLRPGEDVADGVARVLVSPHGDVHQQMLTLIEQERAIRNPADYRSVLAAIAAGRTEVNEIADVSGLEHHTVRHVLPVLAGLDLVRGERNFAASKRAPYRYVVTDNAVRFWHRFVIPNRARLELDDPRRVWEARIAPHLDAYLGHTFETIVRQAYARYVRRWGMPAADEWGRWEGTDRAKRPVEIDIVGRLEDGRLLVGEIKWSSSPHGPSLHTELVAKLARLAASGQGWAHDASTAQYLYASAAGFTPEMEALARADGRIRLLMLDDLYPPD
jgi:uncharacterized protein